MRTVLKAIIIVPIAIVAIVFAVANRQIVTISFDPFNAENPAFALSAPLFLTIILMVMLGVLLGGVATWINQGRVRSEARHARAEAERLRREVQDARLELDLQHRNASQPGRELTLSGRDAA